MKRKNMAIRLIRKQAGGFRVGEWLYLFDCPDGFGGDVYRGSYEIREIKKMTDATVTFICRGVRATTPMAYVEFLRDQEVHRIAGEPLGFIIHEEELL